MPSIEAMPYLEPSPCEGINKIRRRWLEVDSMAGVGVDPDIAKIPEEVWQEVGGRENVADGILRFNQRVIDATSPYAVDYKVNSNFFQGEVGRRALAQTFDYIRERHPNIVRVCDGKFADVGHTAEAIAAEVFGRLDADAVLVNPYMGFDSIKPFVEWQDKVVVVCVNTSNPSADQIQQLELADGMPLWKHVLKQCAGPWNYNGNIIPVLSATHQENLRNIREIIGDTPIVLAGAGTQGGDLKESVPLCLDSKGYGMMISASRAILYPERQLGDTLEDASSRAVQALRTQINAAKISA